MYAFSLIRAGECVTSREKKTVSGIIMAATKYYSPGIFIMKALRTGIWEFYTIDGNFGGPIISIIQQPLKCITRRRFLFIPGQRWQMGKKRSRAKTIWLSSESQWNNFLVNNLKLPEESVPARVPGKVEIRVYIDEKGNATGYKIGNDIEVSLDKEALRVTKLFGPEFVPADNNGTNVKSIYTLIVSYKLADYR